MERKLLPKVDYCCHNYCSISIANRSIPLASGIGADSVISNSFTVLGIGEGDIVVKRLIVVIGDSLMESISVVVWTPAADVEVAAVRVAVVVECV